MSQTIWEISLYVFNNDMTAQSQHILLLANNAPTHRHSAAKYSNIRIEFLPPKLTSCIQPMDASIIQRFKAHYRNRFTLLALDCDNAVIENIHNINQLEAMTIALNAWSTVSPSTIANRLRHTELSVSPVAVDTDNSSQQEQSLLEEMARHPNFMRPGFQHLWTLMGEQVVQTEYSETEE